MSHFLLPNSSPTLSLEFLEKLSLYYIIFETYVCVHFCEIEYHVCAFGGQKMASDPHELELQIVGSLMMWVLRTKLSPWEGEQMLLIIELTL